MPYRDVRAARRFVGQLAEHDPGTVDQREYRVDLLNRHYMSINEAEDWLGLMVEDDWKVWQERDGEDLGITVSVVNGEYGATFSSTLGADFTDAAGGMIFEDDNGDEYTIVRFTSPTTVFFAKDNGTIIGEPYAGSTNAAMTTWKIKSGRYYLPVDCARAEAFINRSNEQWRGSLTIIDRRTEERSLSWYTENNQGTVIWLADNDCEYDRPPDPGYTAVESTGAGSLVSDSIYEVCYTFTLKGRESPPSVPIRVTMSTAANHQIVIAGMEDTLNGLLPTGVLKNVYIRRLTTSTELPSGDLYSRWLAAVKGLSEGTTTYTITAFPNTASGTQLVYQNGRKYMKTVWKPGGDYTFRLRYLRKPARLVADSDAPWWPENYHDLMCYGAAIDLMLSQGASQGKIDRLQKSYDELLRQMKTTQLIVPNVSTVRQMRSDTGRRSFNGYYTNGPAYGNFSGT